MFIQSFKRYEKKYLISRKIFGDFLKKLEEHMIYDKYCQNGERYQISTIYFDTPNNDVIRYSLSGPYYKEKLRLRSYGLVHSANDKVFLEIKKKIDGIVTKRRAVLKYKEAVEFLKERKKPKKIDYLNNQILDEIDNYLKYNDVKPVIYISYDRIALFGKDDPNLRITFDENLLTRREELTLREGTYGANLLSNDEVLMEIKFINALPLWLTDILSDFEIYPTKFSKYGREYQKRIFNNYVLERGE